jgi:hypothetical protein
MPEATLSNTVFIRTSAEDLWRALTDGDIAVQYVGSRVQSSWQPGDEIVYLSPDGATRLVEGRLLEVEPRRRGLCRAPHLTRPSGWRARACLSRALQHQFAPAQHRLLERKLVALQS